MHEIFEVWQADANDMPMTIHTSKSKPEIELQYGGRPFYETGSSFISPWIDISHRNLAGK